MRRKIFEKEEMKNLKGNRGRGADRIFERRRGKNEIFNFGPQLLFCFIMGPKPKNPIGPKARLKKKPEILSELEI